MKANEFVKKFGWDVSTKLSKEMRGITESVADGVAGWGQSEWDKLKRLVESHELVASRGGLCAAKHDLITFQKHLNNTFGWATITTSEKIDRLKQAIADVESCQ